MTADVARNFTAAGRVADMDCVLQVELFGKSREIVGVSVHLIAFPRLIGTAMPTAVVRDHSIAALAKEQHLSIPIVRSKGPTVTEYDGLSRAPVFVVNLRSVFCGNGWHIALLTLTLIRPEDGVERPKTNYGTETENQLQKMNGGRCRIRTYDFHRVKVTLYR